MVCPTAGRTRLAIVENYYRRQTVFAKAEVDVDLSEDSDSAATDLERPGEASLGPEHSAVAGILSNRAVVLRQLKRAVEARSLEQRAKFILEKSAQTARLGYTVDLRELQSSLKEP